ncbi:MAG: transcriptional regulator, LysR family [Burkholderiaceae bacterium]|nr:transcriptional regulator, LysR family [Burkholderiaceae bacterium]
MNFEIDSEITFRKLEIFLAFIKTGNISRAAELLDTSAVSVHRALHSLEAGMKCQLFRREGRALSPTPAAALLAETAREVLEAMSRGISLTRAAAGISSDRLRIGSLYSLTADIAPQVIMQLKAKRPELRIELELGSNEDLLDKLKRSQIDAVLMGIPSGEPDAFDVVPLFEDEIYFACAVNNSQPLPDEIDLHDYREADFVSLTDGFVTYHGFLEAFRIAGFTPKIASQASDIFSLISLVSAGMGFTLLPGRVKDALGSRVRLVPLKSPFRMRQTIGLIFLHAREHDPSLLSLAAVCRQIRRQR